MTPDLKDTISRIQRLPTLPTVLTQVLATVNDPDASALDLAQPIAADQSLSARLLRLVNSAFYGFYRQIVSVTDAVVILGFSEIRDLALTATAFHTLPQGAGFYDRTSLWRHTLAVAMAAERCAKRLGLSQDAGYFSAGLLHDIGKVALDTVYPKPFRRAVMLAESEHARLHDVEPRVFGMDHAAVGAILGEHWNLPEPVVDAIRNHHQPNEAKAPLGYVTAIANCIAYAAGLGDAANHTPPTLPAAPPQGPELPENEIGTMVEELGQVTARIDAMLGALNTADVPA